MSNPDELQPYLEPTETIDADSAAIQEFAERITSGVDGQREQAVRLFYAVRDEIHYDPYQVQLTPAGFRASNTLARKRGFCVPKAILLAAAARACEIPARLGFADVRNHLATRRLVSLMRTDVFAFHGYTELYLSGRWIKATPTFNLSLCDKFGVKPLDFDGVDDAIFHPYDNEGHQHMEYVHDHGHRADLPFDELVLAWERTYPHFFVNGRPQEYTGDFEREAGEKTG